MATGNKKLLVSLLIAASVLFGAAGCSMSGISPPAAPEASQTDSPEVPETATPAPEAEAPPEGVGLAYYTSSPLNPYQCDNTFNRLIGCLIYEGLFELTPEFEPVPRLCESYETSDNLSWKFTLKKDVRFSDGRLLTARDVAYSYGLASAANSAFAPRFEDVMSIVPADDETVVITLKKANVFFPRLLDIPVIPDGSGDEAAPPGTGPYVFSEGAEGRSLVKNRYRPSPQGADSIALIETKSQEQTLYDFQTGRVNIVVYDRTRPGTVVYRGNSERARVGTTTMQYIGFNTDRFFTGETGVRAALSLGIDRKAIADNFFEGFADAAVLPVSPLSAAYDNELADSYAYEEGAMFSALYETGFRDTDGDGILERYKTKFSLDFIVNNDNRNKVSAALMIADTMREAGIDVTLRVLEWDDYMRALNARNFDLYYGEINLKSDFDLRSLLYSYAPLNYGNYSNATADEMLSGYMEGTVDAREFYTFLAQSAPIVPILFKAEHVLYTRGLVKQMYATSSNPFYRFSDWIFTD